MKIYQKMLVGTASPDYEEAMAYLAAEYWANFAAAAISAGDALKVAAGLADKMMEEFLARFTEKMLEKDEDPEDGEGDL